MTAGDASSNGAARRFVEYWHTPQGATIPEPVLRRARLCLLDTIGCGLFGARQPAGRIIARVVLADESRGPCTLFGSASGVAPAQAALANGTAMHGFELDDLIPSALVHPGTVIAPAVLAAAEAADASAADLDRAMVIGYEAMARLSLALGTEPSQRGFHKTAVVGPVGAAIAAAAVLGLDAARTLHAAGLACSAASGIKAYTAGGGGGMVKGTHGGRPAEAGVRMAMLAREGFTGPRAGVDGRYGLLEVFGGATADPAALWEGLGETWAMDGVWTKVYPVCGWIQGAMQLLQQLRGAHPLPLARVRRLTIGTSAFAVKHNANAAPSDTGEAQYSLPYCAAVGLAGDPQDAREFEAAAWGDAQRRDFASRVELEVDAESEAVFPKRFGTRIRLELDDGTVRTAATYDPHGTPASPCSVEEVVAKFRGLSGLPDGGRFADALIAMEADSPVRETMRTLGVDRR